MSRFQILKSYQYIVGIDETNIEYLTHDDFEMIFWAVGIVSNLRLKPWRKRIVNESICRIIDKMIELEREHKRNRFKQSA